MIRAYCEDRNDAHHVTSSVSPHHRYHLARALWKSVFSSFLHLVLYSHVLLHQRERQMVYLGETTDAAAMYYARRARASQLTKKKSRQKKEREKKKWSRASVFEKWTRMPLARALQLVIPDEFLLDEWIYPVGGDDRKKRRSWEMYK